MGIVASLLGLPSARKTTDVSALTWERLLGEPATKVGVSVNLDSAFRVSVVLACARVIAEGIAQMPLKLYRQRPDGGKDLAQTHPLYRLLWRRPNDWMTSFDFREALTLHTVLAGNAYAYKNVVNGQIRELLPIMPNQVRVEQTPDYELLYHISDAKGGKIGTVPRAAVLHLRGPNWNGYIGFDMVRMAREAIGLAIATEETHSRLFSNGAQPGGILSFEGMLGDDALKTIRESWKEAQEGVSNKFKTAVLDNGATWTPLAMKGVDSEHLATRRFQIEEVCRFLRVFPQMVMQSDKTSTFASAEAFFLAHVTHTLTPWAERWEQAIDRDLIDERDAEHFAKFSMQGLMRGDARSRAEYFKAALGAGGSPAWMRPNEVRALEDMNPDPEGDYLPLPTKSTTGDEPDDPDEAPEDPPQPNPREE